MEQIDFFKIKNKLIDIAETNRLTMEDMVTVPRLNFNFLCNSEAAYVFKRSGMIKNISKTNKGRCLFFPENKAYTEHKKNKLDLYISKNEQNNTYFSMNVFDLYEVINRQNYYDTLLWLIDQTGVQTEERIWIRKQNEIFSSNQSIIESVDILQKKKIIKYYKSIIEIAKKRLSSGWNQAIIYENKYIPVSMASTRFIGQNLNLDFSTVSRLVRYFLAVGLFIDLDCFLENKMESKKDWEDKERLLTNPTKFSNSISKFLIPPLTLQNIKIILRNIELLDEFKISKSNISVNKIKQLNSKLERII